MSTDVEELYTILNPGGVILVMLYVNGKMHESELIKKSEMSSSTIMRWREILAKRGYITIERKKDSLNVKLFLDLTEKGKIVANNLLRLSTRFNEIIEEP
nr:MarR family transcriptional regulator [Sulfolobus tengchongensis]